jgi:hypothetical protein
MKFISDGTWFDKGTEVKILDEHCTVFYNDGRIPTLQVLARGLRNGREDEEVCTMNEFYVVGDDFKANKVK